MTNWHKMEGKIKMKLYSGHTFNHSFNWSARNGLNMMEYIHSVSKERRRAYFKAIKAKGV